MYPRIQYQLNKELDKEMMREFFDMKAGGIDFSQGIYAMHPALHGKKNERDIWRYCDEYYKENYTLLQRKRNSFQKEWDTFGPPILQAMQNVFYGMDYPKGKYKGYLSIIDCNPRFVWNKTFQVFFNHPLEVRFTTAHEILHFLFFAYMEEHHPDIYYEGNPEEGYLWDMSEIFNSVVLSRKEFVKLHDIDRMIYYPNHEKGIRENLEKWNKMRDTDLFINDLARVVMYK